MADAVSDVATDVDATLGRSGLSRSEALILLAHASGWTRARLIAGSGERLPTTVVRAFGALAARRLGGEPIAYLVGRREFYGRAFAVDARVLIPRPETELVVDCALRRIDAGAATHVVDLGTGSGAIAITLALERPALVVTAVDRSAAALAVARANASALAANVEFVAGDWYDALDAGRRFGAIVANPPYVARGDRHLAEGDLRFEPAAALTDGADGLSAIRRIVAGAPVRLEAGGALVVEHGHDQAAAVRALFATAGFDAIDSSRDLAGIERVTTGVRPVTYNRR